MRTRTQKFSLPFTLTPATLDGSVKVTFPFCENALVPSENGLPLTVDAAWPVFAEVPSSTHDPLQASHRSLRSLDGAAGGGVWSVAPGFVTWTSSVMVAPPWANASFSASQSVSLNFGFSPNG